MENNSRNGFDMLCMESLMRLYAGCLDPVDRKILASAPLPSDFTDPYLAEDIRDVRESMKLTCNAMTVWIEEAKKANYFSRHFVKLSQMIMKGVTLMGRGLITLHARGEDLSDAPMSVNELISVASYHFRKSYLGVLQTASSYPEISERLLINQIGWNNMLMRLFKTREKLSKPVAIGCDPGPKESLPAAERVTAVMPAAIFGKSGKNAFSEPEAITEPGALTAPRAFSSYEHAKRSGSRRSTAALPSAAENKDTEKEVKQMEKPAAEESPQRVDKAETPVREAENKPQEIEQTKDPADKTPTETGDRPEAGTQDRNEQPRSDKLPGKGETPDALNPDPGRSRSSPEAEPEGDPPDEADKDGLPEYLKILKRAYARSAQQEDGRVMFTWDEVRFLAYDPYFNKYYTENAKQMREALAASDP